MQKLRPYLWLGLLVVAILALAGCTPRPGQGTTPPAPGADVFVVDLPAITIDYDLEGTPSLGGAPVEALAAAFGVAGVDLSLPAAQIQQLVDANIQHIQLATGPGELKILVNGEPIPTLRWESESISAAGNLLTGLGPVPALLPVLDKLGAGVTIRLPLAQGAEIIPLEGTGAAAAAASADTEAFLASVGSPAQINVPILYNADGSWTMAGMTDTEWTAVTGQAFWQSLRLPEETIANLKEAGVSEILVSTDENGLHIAIDDTNLPTLDWSDGKLNTVLNLAVNAGLLDSLGDETDSTALVEALQKLLPILTTSQLNVRLVLPE